MYVLEQSFAAGGRDDVVVVVDEEEARRWLAREERSPAAMIDGVLCLKIRRNNEMIPELLVSGPSENASVEQVGEAEQRNAVMFRISRAKSSA